jgi:hypothetical protein
VVVEKLVLQNREVGQPAESGWNLVESLHTSLAGFGELAANNVLPNRRLRRDFRTGAKGTAIPIRFPIGSNDP